ncbi:GntP family permease [Streptomyces sp. NBC_01335]|uniref:GntP family permease n=1 Tax=Streptomyces sp. NBC_01335 TaxID=2903828 RepID=UPI002E14F759|nr:GntP family permease [Streptomyces sp. NBC_01335]
MSSTSTRAPGRCPCWAASIALSTRLPKTVVTSTGAARVPSTQVASPTTRVTPRSRAWAAFADRKAHQVRHVLAFMGEPVIAMLAGVLFALFALGYRSGLSSDAIRSALTDSLKAVAGILLIIAGGGAFNQVLKDSGIGQAVESAATGMHINVIVLGWLTALLLSFSTGSATVGIVAATGILAPLAQDGGSLHTSLLVVAIGAGSIGLNYVNHAGFWLVKESFGMTLGQATKSHTAIQTIVSVCGLLMALLLSVFA